MFDRLRIRRRRKTVKRETIGRRCRVETLEPRTLLAPVVSGVSPSLVGVKLPEGTTFLQVAFSEAVTGGAMAGNYQLQGVGADGLLGTGDDNLVPLTPSYNAGTATLGFAALPKGSYRLTIRDNIMDLAGHRLDGDGNGTAGGNWVRDFVANASLLDGAFGQSGRATLPFSVGDGNQAVQAVAMQSDGKIIVAGWSENASRHVFSLARYNANGSLDATFSGDGKVTTAFGALDAEATSVAIQSDGKIVVAGRSDRGGNYDFAVARYNADGTLDTTFSGDGKLTTPIGPTYDEARGVAIQPDGKIVVAGYSRKADASRTFFALARYSASGALDTSFGAGGTLTTAFSSLSSDRAYSVAIQPIGTTFKIVVAGSSDAGNGGNDDFALARYNADDGAPDTSFGGDNSGMVTTSFGGGYDDAYGLAVQPDGKLVVAGSSDSTGNNCFALARYSADGVLDTTGFGTGGKVTTAIGAADDVASSVVIQSDGKIVVAGSSDIGTDVVRYAFALARYNADGSLDTTAFNASDPDPSKRGKVTTAVGAANDYANGLAIQSDGKIVVAGYSGNGSNDDFAAARYNANGSLDTTGFNASDPDPSKRGKVTTAIGSSDDVGYSLAIQSDGKIVVAGRSFNGSDYDFAVARYNANGTPDAMFNGGSMVTTAFGAADDVASSVVVQSNGKIVVAGYSYNGSDYDFAVARYNADGSLDTTGFNASDPDPSKRGKLTTAVGLFDDRANAVAIQSDGKIVVAGSSDIGTDVVRYAFAVARYNADGSLDTTAFNANDPDPSRRGKVVTAFHASDDVAYSLAIQPDGRIVAAGRTFTGSTYDFAVARYNTDGSPDTAFNVYGKQTTPIGSADDYARSVAVQADGKIVVAGYSDNGSNYDFALARYNTDGSLDTTAFNASDADPSKRGKLTTPIGASDDRAYSVAIQANGKIVAAGGSDNGSNYLDFAVARYNADGSLDVTFDGNGKHATTLGASDEAGFSMAVQANGNIVMAGTMYLPQSQLVLVRYLPKVLTVSADDWMGARLTLKLSEPGGDGKIHVYRTGTSVDAVPPQMPADVVTIEIAGPGGPSAVLTIDTSNGNPVPDGGLRYTGSGQLAKTGPGATVLGLANTYQGDTTVNIGTLVVANVSALPQAGSLTIGSGGTVTLSAGLGAPPAASNVAAAALTAASAPIAENSADGPAMAVAAEAPNLHGEAGAVTFIADSGLNRPLSQQVGSPAGSQDLADGPALPAVSAAAARVVATMPSDVKPLDRISSSADELAWVQAMTDLLTREPLQRKEFLIPQAVDAALAQYFS